MAEKLQILYTFQVKESCQLLDFLLIKLANMSRNNVKSYLSRKQVLIDGSVVSQHNFMLSKGDIVQINKFSLQSGLKPNKIKLDIVYEDEDFIAINKPCGLLSVASDTEKLNNAYALLMQYVQQKNKQNRIYLLHRIDKETSGVLVVCKNEKLHQVLQLHWNDYVKTRQYIAICEGKFEKKSGTIRSYLHKDANNLMYSSKNKNGQESITHYQVLQESNSFSLVDVKIDTGRKNQIRVHMKDLHHPIVGDDKYRCLSNPIQRLGLHAKTLQFVHPFTKKLFTFTAPLPKEFKKLFSNT